MIKQSWVPSSIIIMAALLSIGAVVSTFLEIGDARGYLIFMVIIPRIIIYSAILYLMLQVVFAKLFLNGDFVRFFFILIALSFGGTIVAVFIESILKHELSANMQVIDFSNPYIWAYIFSNSVLFIVITIGIISYRLYRRWKNQIECEQKLIRDYENVLSPIKQQLESLNLTKRIETIIDSIQDDDIDVQTQIENLSDELRNNLYSSKQPLLGKTDSNSQTVIGDSILFTFLTGTKYAALRWMILEILITIISLGAFFPCFQLNFGLFNLSGVIISIISLSLIALVNRFLIFPAFSDFRKYLVAISLPVVIWGIIALITNLLTFTNISGSETFTHFMAIISSFGTMMVVGVFWLGIGGFLCFQEWLKTERRVSLLTIKNTKAEYSLLKQQLNPHFLFNVLNNIDFIVEEDKVFAIKMLQDLNSLLSYHLSSSKKHDVTVADDIKFLESYLSLEKMRHKSFNYRIEVDENVLRDRIPPLLLMPFVENAVKHGSVSHGQHLIEISINGSTTNVCFRCANTISESILKSRKDSGIGIKNSRERLELLFCQNYSLEQNVIADKFVTNLIIPKNQ